MSAERSSKIAYAGYRPSCPRQHYSIGILLLAGACFAGTVHGFGRAHFATWTSQARRTSPRTGVWTNIATGPLIAQTLRSSLGDDDSSDMEFDDFDDGDDDDMGLGVSRTVGVAAPRPDDLLGTNRNAILELAEAAQEVSDDTAPSDEFERKYARKGGQKRSGDSSESKITYEHEADENVDDRELGMGVSGTIAATNRERDSGKVETELAADITLLQGGELTQELDKMNAKDARRGKMEAQGLSDEQIAAYLGDDLSETPQSAAARQGDRALAMFQEAASSEELAWINRDDKLKVAPSSTLVDTDEDGDPYIDRFVYVDEYTCIACTHCTHVAPSTFFLEEENGRARVYQQGRDTDEAIGDAILTCPVDCIHFVDWQELKRLEAEREGIDINFKAKLVGNEVDNIRNGQQMISGNQGMRCNNCPTKGCYNCPMYGVGNNPEYTKRKARSEEKKRARLKARRDEMRGSQSAEL